MLDPGQHGAAVDRRGEPGRSAVEPHPPAVGQRRRRPVRRRPPAWHRARRPGRAATTRRRARRCSSPGGAASPASNAKRAPSSCGGPIGRGIRGCGEAIERASAAASMTSPRRSAAARRRHLDRCARRPSRRARSARRRSTPPAHPDPVRRARAARARPAASRPCAATWWRRPADRRRGTVEGPPVASLGSSLSQWRHRHVAAPAVAGDLLPAGSLPARPHLVGPVVLAAAVHARDRHPDVLPQGSHRFRALRRRTELGCRLRPP